ncbi:MAG: RNA polymerase sigma factor [Bacteroidota bacterium]
MTQAYRESIYHRWLRDHRAILFKVVRSYASTREDEEDLFQEIALQLWRSVPAFRAESLETTWLYRIALNVALKWSAREERRLQREPEKVLSEDNNNDQLEWLYERIRQLPKTDRSLILLLLDGFSYREMAEMIGISESNVGVKIHRIKQQLAAAAKTPESHGI